MSWSKEKRKEFLEKTKWLTLLHMHLMVSKKTDPGGTGKGQYKFFEMMLSDDIRELTGIKDTGKISYVQTLMRKGFSDGVSPELYDNIYGLLDKSGMKTQEKRFQFLHKQYEKLKELAKENPEEYAFRLWGAMDTSHGDIDASYMDIFRQRSPWLFRDHEKELEGFDVDRTYKLLTVAIAISLNQKTSITDNTTDNLDNLCKEFLYADPPEELPAFTLRDVFDTLFPDDEKFAVKRSRDDDYVMVEWDDVTDRDKLCILLPWLGVQYDLHPNSEEAAKALLDNNQVDKDMADRLRGFFRCFSNRPDSIWNEFVAHLEESLPQCSRAEQWKRKPKAKIDELLKQELPSGKIPSYSERYLDILCDNSQWNRIDCDGFWDGDQVDISLPTECMNEDDVQQLYQYITAYVLIALCCVKANGNATPVKRKEFKSALIQIINKPNAEVNSALKDAYAKIDKLEQELDKERTDNAEKDRVIEEKDRIIGKQNHTIAAIFALLNGLLSELHLSSPIERREHIENFCQHMGLTLDQIPEFDKLVNGYDDPKTRRLTTDSADWGNGGIK